MALCYLVEINFFLILKFINTVKKTTYEKLTSNN